MPRTPTRSDPDALVELSVDLLTAVREGAADAAVDRVAGLDDDDLLALGEDAAAATAFWCNVYNAAAQRRLRAADDPFADKSEFFGTPSITVAGAGLSLDEIEHGILRGSKWKYGLGYLPDPLPSEFERRHRLREVDCRIHFALNCGAESCPLVRPYRINRVDADLDAAARSYLVAECEYDPDAGVMGRSLRACLPFARSDAGVVRVPRLLLWYRGDFGGRQGIYDLLERYGVVPADAAPRIRYREYDWTLAPGRFLARE